jgi:hypothetical protein
MVLLDSDYEFLEQFGTGLNIVAIMLIAGGEFARRAVPRVKDVAVVAEVVGWISWAALSVVATQRAAERSVECSIFGRDCPTSAGSELWNAFSPYLIDALVGAAATLAGWVAAKAWLAARRPSRPAQPR